MKVAFVPMIREALKSTFESQQFTQNNQDGRFYRESNGVIQAIEIKVDYSFALVKNIEFCIYIRSSAIEQKLSEITNRPGLKDDWTFVVSSSELDKKSKGFWRFKTENDLRAKVSAIKSYLMNSVFPWLNEDKSVANLRDYICQKSDSPGGALQIIFTADLLGSDASHLSIFLSRVKAYIENENPDYLWVFQEAYNPFRSFDKRFFPEFQHNEILRANTLDVVLQKECFAYDLSIQQSRKKDSDLAQCLNRTVLLLCDNRFRCTSVLWSEVVNAFEAVLDYFPDYTVQETPSAYWSGEFLTKSVMYPNWNSCVNKLRSPDFTITVESQIRPGFQPSFNPLILLSYRLDLPLNCQAEIQKSIYALSKLLSAEFVFYQDRPYCIFTKFGMEYCLIDGTHVLFRLGDPHKILPSVKCLTGNWRNFD